jgi:acyl CoA:acetate/3-ketoacid CoA transferase beta subunit
MNAQSLIAKRTAHKLRDGNPVDLGIGIPTLMALPWLTDAGRNPVTALPGPSTFDSAISVGLIRGGHFAATEAELAISPELSKPAIPKAATGAAIPFMGEAI